MHHRYNTEALVLTALPHGEAHRTITLLTPELGRLHASARGVRKQGAKLAPALQPYACAQVSLVRGRGQWRIIGATEQFNAYYACEKAPEARKSIARILLLARRLVAGEGSEQKLYQHVREALLFLAREELSREEQANTECLTVLRMLSALGYVGEHPNFDVLLSETEFSREKIAALTPFKQQAIRTINASLSASEL